MLHKRSTIKTVDMTSREAEAEGGLRQSRRIALNPAIAHFYEKRYWQLSLSILSRISARESSLYLQKRVSSVWPWVKWVCTAKFEI